MLTQVFRANPPIQQKNYRQKNSKLYGVKEHYFDEVTLMWDYNNDGIVDDQDESDYWDDVYYEEHRGDYTTGLFSASSNGTSAKQATEAPKGAGDIAGSILLYIGFIFVVVICGFLAFFGLLVCVVFPPLGIIMMIPLYKILGGR